MEWPLKVFVRRGGNQILQNFAPILKLLSCRTDGLDAVNKLSERNIVLDGTILSVKQTGGNIFVSAEDRFTNRLAN